MSQWERISGRRRQPRFAESVGDGFEVFERLDVGLLLRCVRATGRERHDDLVSRFVCGLLDSSASTEDDEIRERDFFSAVSRVVEILLDALEAMRQGDFSVRLPRGAAGIAGKVAEAFNEIVAANERMAEQLETVGLVVGREGETRKRVKFGLSGVVQPNVFAHLGLGMMGFAINANTSELDTGPAMDIGAGIDFRIVPGFLLGAQYQTAFLFSLLVVILVARNWWRMRQRKVLK